MSLGSRSRSSCVAFALLAGCARSAELQLGASRGHILEPLPALAGRFWQADSGAAAEPTARVVAAHSGGLMGGEIGPRGEAALWQRDADVSELPLLAGGVVVFGHGARFEALDAATGAPLWSVPRAAAHLAALADDGQSSALVLEDARHQLRWLSVIDRAGTERFRIQATADLGTPALHGRSLLVPWGSHFVSLIDTSSGSELGRAGVEPSLQHVLWSDGQPLLAGPPWLSLGPAGVRQLLPPRPLPGRVQVGDAAIAAGPVADVTRLFAHLPRAADAPPRALLATYGRLALSLESERGSLEWVRLYSADVLGAAVGNGSVVLCDASGVLRVLSADGARTLQVLRLGRARRSEAALQACALSVQGEWSVSAARSEADLGEALVDQLARVLAPSDPELANAQRFLSRELAMRPEPEATRVLIALASRQNADPLLQAEAEDLLATRRNGADFMLQALERSGPRSADPVARAPVAALADALEALEERRAAPLLALQLNRLGHSAAALARVARALENLASDAEYSPLQVFFSVRHTSAEPPELVEAVLSVGRTLLRIGAAPGRRLVQWAARDPLTAPEVRAQLGAALER